MLFFIFLIIHHCSNFHFHCPLFHRIHFSTSKVIATGKTFHTECKFENEDRSFLTFSSYDKIRKEEFPIFNEHTIICTHFFYWHVKIRSAYNVFLNHHFCKRWIDSSSSRYWHWEHSQHTYLIKTCNKQIFHINRSDAQRNVHKEGNLHSFNQRRNYYQASDITQCPCDVPLRNINLLYMLSKYGMNTHTSKRY